jgi:hypothetical protein
MDYNIKNIPITFYPDVKNKLLNIKNLNNICIVGNEFSGKRNVIYSMFNIEENKLKNEIFEFSKNKEYIVSNYRTFYELNCSKLGYYDKHILNHITNEISHSKNMASYIEKNIRKPILCLRNIHLLSIDAHYCLRGIIDKYSSNIHFVYTCLIKQNVPQSLISRQIQYSIGNINIKNDEDVINIINTILPKKYAKKILKDANNLDNFKKIINNTFKKYNSHILKTFLNLKNILLCKSPIISLEEYYNDKIDKFIDESLSLNSNSNFNKCTNSFRDLMYEMMRIQISNEDILEYIYNRVQNKINNLSIELINLWNEFNSKFCAYYRPIFIFELFWLRSKRILIKNIKKNKKLNEKSNINI